MRRLFLFVNLDFPDPHFLAGYNRYLITSTVLTGAKYGRKRRVGVTIETVTTSGDSDDVDAGALQQGTLTAYLKTERNRIGNHTAQFADLDIYG